MIDGCNQSLIHCDGTAVIQPIGSNKRVYLPAKNLRWDFDDCEEASMGMRRTFLGRYSDARFRNDEMLKVYAYEYPEGSIEDIVYSLHGFTLVKGFDITLITNELI